MQGQTGGRKRFVASTRFAVLLESGGSDREEALRIAFVDTFAPTQCGLTTFTESMVGSISQHTSQRQVPWKAQGMHHSGAAGMCRATGRASYGP
jgi:hypothetical protein